MQNYIRCIELGTGEYNGETYRVFQCGRYLGPNCIKTWSVAVDEHTTFWDFCDCLIEINDADAVLVQESLFPTREHLSVLGLDRITRGKYQYWKPNLTRKG